MVMEVMCSVQPREGIGNARTDGVRQLSGQRAKDSGSGDEVVADECKQGELREQQIQQMGE
jgi:hypothetical protein